MRKEYLDSQDSPSRAAKSYDAKDSILPDLAKKACGDYQGGSRRAQSMSGSAAESCKVAGFASVMD